MILVSVMSIAVSGQRSAVSGQRSAVSGQRKYSTTEDTEKKELNFEQDNSCS
jgi:hypothetical protein